MCGALSPILYWGPGPQLRHVTEAWNGFREPLVVRRTLNPLSYTHYTLLVILLPLFLRGRFTVARIILIVQIGSLGRPWKHKGFLGTQK